MCRPCDGESTFSDEVSGDVSLSKVQWLSLDAIVACSLLLGG